MIKNINDVSEHGNIGLFSIASYDSQFTLKHYYNVPLLPFNLPLGEHGKWVSQKWEEFCELNKIKTTKTTKMDKYTSVQKANSLSKEVVS
jgi:Zn-dependent peptidase ImmA (M78 family)